MLTFAYKKKYISNIGKIRLMPLGNDMNWKIRIIFFTKKYKKDLWLILRYCINNPYLKQIVLRQEKGLKGMANKHKL